jgi:hypothetical protein
MEPTLKVQTFADGAAADREVSLTVKNRTVQKPLPCRLILDCP